MQINMPLDSVSLHHISKYSHFEHVFTSNTELLSTAKITQEELFTPVNEILISSFKCTGILP
jgi:hypothetical protein